MDSQHEYIILSENLKGLLEQYTPEEREAVFEMYKHYQGQYTYNIKNNDPLSVVYSFLKEIDSEIEKQFKKDPDSKAVKCKKGCYFCCEQNIDVSPLEARMLHYVITEDKITIDMEKLRRQANFSMESWHDQPEDDWSCIFLQKDHSCAVYEYRPASCRKYFSASPRKLCDTHRKHQKIKRFVNIYAEILGAVIFNREGSGPLPNMLLKIINNS